MTSFNNTPRTFTNVSWTYGTFSAPEGQIWGLDYYGGDFDSATKTLTPGPAVTLEKDVFAPGELLTMQFLLYSTDDFNPRSLTMQVFTDQTFGPIRLDTQVVFDLNVCSQVLLPLVTKSD